MNWLGKALRTLKAALWPDKRFTSYQWKIVDSVCEDDETFVVAANEVGKDFIAGFLCVGLFQLITPCRIVTTSAGEDHLSVLWGEINRFIDTAAFPLSHKQGGNLIINHHHITKMLPGGRSPCRISYLKGLVASDENIAKMQGHHATPDTLEEAIKPIPRTYFFGDEASSLKDEYKRMADTWASRKFIFGNAWPCDNFFRRAVEGDPENNQPGGDIPRDPNDPSKGYHRRVLHIPVEESPNVKLNLIYERRGETPPGTVLVPGVKTWQKYVRERKTWDALQLSVSHGARFYKGKELVLFPADWLQHSKALARELFLTERRRRAQAIGVDPGEGSAATVLTAVDERGVIQQRSLLTPDTNEIIGELIAFGNYHRVRPEDWCIDRGGGGKQLADRLRAYTDNEHPDGYNVRTVAFGDPPSRREPRLGIERSLEPVEDKVSDFEERYAYLNCRAQMYGNLSILCDPTGPTGGFAIPAQLTELHRQLSLIPKRYTSEGRLKLPPKNRVPGMPKGEKTLQEIMGRSPDEADSLVLAVWGMLNPAVIVEIGAMG